MVSPEHSLLCMVSPEHSLLCIVSPEHSLLCMVSPEHSLLCMVSPEHSLLCMVSPEHSLLCIVSPEHSLLCMVSPEHFPSPQGVTAQQKEADVKALEARLKASEHSVEVITSLSTPQLQPPLSASRTITKSSSHLVIPQGLPPPPLLLHDTESTSSEDGKHSDSSSEVSSAIQSRPRSSSHGR